MKVTTLKNVTSVLANLHLDDVNKLKTTTFDIRGSKYSITPSGKKKESIKPLSKKDFEKLQETNFKIEGNNYSLKELSITQEFEIAEGMFDIMQVVGDDTKLGDFDNNNLKMTDYVKILKKSNTNNLQKIKICFGIELELLQKVTGRVYEEMEEIANKAYSNDRLTEKFFAQ